MTDGDDSLKRSQPNSHPAASTSSQSPPPHKGASRYAIRLFGPKDDHSICKLYTEKAKKTPRVRELVGAISDLGCTIDIDTMVECRQCNIAATGGFIANHQGLKEGEYRPRIVVCEDNLLGSHYVAQTLAHELVHAYDQCRAKVNWQSCYHYACTEIRASTLSGECDFIEEFDRGNFGMRAQHQECVRRRAELSMQVAESCKDRAKEVIEKVFKRCYQDTAPYDKIP
ncbi:mitochondrial inner membrane protease atp23 [Nannochloropsis gaditana]|uniref:Mitochondrial inner membrane protease ATP23 n=1 Tax=Nannochloropsis gaditana TaxID=72520 RepID=W7TN46_9STRA|nr:mitochondrial inner membrane protease atp23 [Nannochloropsis gaditana]